MEYRTLGRSSLQVGVIGLGTEHLLDLPRQEVVSIVHEALDHGVNYFDLFLAQPEFRDNMGAAFRGHRDQAYLTAHLGSAYAQGQNVRTRDVEESERFFEDYLRRFGTEYVDVLFIHNCDEQEDYDLIMGKGHLLDLARRLQEEGKARFLGFSGHTVSTALQAVQSGAIDVLMFPINLAGNALPGKDDLLMACARNEVGLVAMKPFAGGRLLGPERTLMMERWQVGGGDIRLERSLAPTPVQCLAYALAQPGICTAVPGCRNTTQLAEALAYLEASPAQRDFAPLLEDYDRYRPGECVYCNHCLPCPAFIDIGAVSRLLDRALAGDAEAARRAYQELDATAIECLECGECEERCPFGVQIVQRMRLATEVLA